MSVATQDTYEIDNRNPTTTILNVRVEVNPSDLFINALENLCDEGAMPDLYRAVINALVEYAGNVPQAEDDKTIIDPDEEVRKVDFLVYLQCAWNITL